MQENEKNFVPFPFESSEDSQKFSTEMNNQEKIPETLPEIEQPEKTDDFLWNIIVEGKKLGPFTTQEVKNSIKSKDFSPNFMAWRAGFNDWFRIKDFAEFREIIREIAPEHLSIKEDSILKEQLLCPNCYAKIPVSAKICPSCSLTLKISELPFQKHIQQKEPWHFRITVIGGFLMLIGLILPWINIGKAGTINGFSVVGSAGFIFLALLATVLGLQNLKTKPKRNLSIWLIAGAALILAMNLSINLISKKNQIIEQVQIKSGMNLLQPANSSNSNQDEHSNFQSATSLISSGLIIYFLGALFILLAVSLPTFYRIIEKPVSAVFVVIFAVLCFLAHVQLLNGNAYKFIFETQLRVQGFEITEIKRVSKVHNIFDNSAEFEIYATKSSAQQSFDEINNNNQEPTKEYYYARKEVQLGSIFGLHNIELNQILEAELPLYEEFSGNNSP